MNDTEIDAFLREPRIADLATVCPDGSPHVAPIWYHYDGNYVKFVAYPEAIKLRNIDQDPRVALSVATQDEPYRYAMVRGIAERTAEDSGSLILSMALKYKGDKEGPQFIAGLKNKHRLCSVIITPSRIIGWTHVP